jgi:hypothetical protein
VVEHRQQDQAPLLRLCRSTKTTPAFFLFYFKEKLVNAHQRDDSARGAQIGCWRFANEAAHRRSFGDGVAVAAEQAGYEEHYDAPIAELSPAVAQFQQLTIRKWEEYLPAHPDAGKAAAPLGQLRAHALRYAKKGDPEVESAVIQVDRARRIISGTAQPLRKPPRGRLMRLPGLTPPRHPEARRGLGG